MAKNIRAKEDGKGYVAGVRCGVGHSGNHLLAGPVNGAYECQGCAKFYTAEHVIEAQRNPALREIGQGGLIAR